MDCKVCNTEMTLAKHKVYKCPNCRHIFINFTGDGIEYHKTLYRKGKNEGQRGTNEVKDGVFTKEFHARREPICNKRVKKLHEHAPDYISVLDIGAGGGTFVGKLKYRTADISVQEVSDLCVSNLKLQGYKNVYHGDFNELKFPKQYDLVTCYHVLEHIEDLQAYKSKLLEVAKKYVAIEVPVNRDLRNPDKNWDGHYHYFSTDSMKKLFGDDFEFLYLGKGVQMPALLAIMKRK